MTDIAGGPDKLEPPFDDWQALSEDMAIDKLQSLYDQAEGAGTLPVAHAAILGVGNYAYVVTDWEKLLDRARDLLEKIEGASQSKRWG